MDSEHGPCALIVSIVAIIINIAIVVTCFVLNLIVATQKDYSFKQMESLGKNYDLNPLYMIDSSNLFEIGQTCRSDLEEIELGTWYGIREGCLKDGKPSEECGEGDKKLAEIEGQVITELVQGGNKIKLCYKKSTKTYKELYDNGYIYKKDDTCPSGTTNCGPIDKFDNIYCAPVGESCPINFLQIKTDGTTPADCGTTFNCKKHEIPSTPFNIVIYYSNDEYKNKNTKQRILTSKFEISEDTPCADPDHLVTKNLYLLENNYVKDCPNVADYTKDTRISDSIASLPKSFILPNATTLQTEYGYDTSAITNIYPIPYYGLEVGGKILKYQVTSKDSYDDYKHNVEEFDKYALVAFIFNCISLAWSFIKPICDCKKTDEEKKKPGCFDCLMSIAGLLCVIFIIVSFAKCTYTVQDVDLLDPITKELAKHDYTDVKESWVFLLVLLILNLFGIALALVICFCSILLACCCACFGN